MQTKRVSEFQKQAAAKKLAAVSLLRNGVSVRDIKYALRCEFGSSVSSSTLSKIQRQIEDGSLGSDIDPGDPTDRDHLGSCGTQGDPNPDPSQIQALEAEIERLGSLGSDLKTGFNQLYTLFLAFNRELKDSPDHKISVTAFKRLVTDTLDLPLIDRLKGSP
jgi:hypothetical protein